MLRVLIPLFVGMVWLVLETTLVGFLPIRFPSPDVVLIVVIVFSFRYSLSFGGCLSFILGLVQDVSVGGVVGLNALSKTVVFFLTTLIVRRLQVPTLIFTVVMVVLGGVVDGLVVIVVSLVGVGIHIPSPILVRYLLLHILSTGLLAPLVIIVTTKILGFGERGNERIGRYGHNTTRARRT